MNAELTAAQLRVLEMLAGAEPNGCTERALAALGCSVDTLADIIRCGLASMSLERMTAGDRTLDVARIKITDAGRQAIVWAIGR
jgi:hypothetical protein